MAVSSANHAIGYVIPWIIFAMAIFSYYAYVVSTCSECHPQGNANNLTHSVQYLIQTESRIGQAIPYMIFYHVFLFMAVWSYIRVVFTDPGRPPRSDAQKEGSAASQATSQMPLHYACDELGRPRWCDHCKVIKPNRTHHDSETNR